MTVVRIDERRGLALCADDEGARHTVETALVEPLAAGRVVLVHAGVAIAALPGEGPPPAVATSLQRSTGKAALQHSEEVAIHTAAAAAGGPREVRR